VRDVGSLPPVLDPLPGSHRGYPSVPINKEGYRK
jgi:hypothetical protein